MTDRQRPIAFALDDVHTGPRGPEEPLILSLSRAQLGPWGMAWDYPGHYTFSRTDRPCTVVIVGADSAAPGACFDLSVEVEGSQAMFPLGVTRTGDDRTDALLMLTAASRVLLAIDGCDNPNEISEIQETLDLLLSTPCQSSDRP